MKKLNLVGKTPSSISMGAVLTLASSSVLAHVDYSHAQHDVLSGLLHALTTHPIVFASTGIAIIVVSGVLRQ